jgi:hypothetical protein
VTAALSGVQGALIGAGGFLLGAGLTFFGIWAWILVDYFKRSGGEW